MFQNAHLWEVLWTLDPAQATPTWDFRTYQCKRLYHVLSIAFVESIIQRSSHSCQCDWLVLPRRCSRCRKRVHGWTDSERTQNFFSKERKTAKGSIFFPVTSLCQRYRQKHTKTKMEREIGQEERRQGQENYRVKSRCIGWQNAKAHMREYPPNEEEYPQPTWCAGTTHFAACVSAHFLIHQTSFAKVVNVHHPGLGASETRQAPTEQTKNTRNRRLGNRKVKVWSPVHSGVPNGIQQKSKNEKREERVHLWKRKKDCDKYIHIYDIYIYEGYAHLWGLCTSTGAMCTQDKTKIWSTKGKMWKRKEKMRSVQMDIRREKKLVKNIN